ncbi:hypothetical protein PCANC_22919 [Puccinia coronata f. sp. avenae]|uniref:Uncharacterized protein n=1 Tax=Puccinia coronata f. sp. avenae TaxID=200324 RepID=A0A2N5UDP1_9BASI|nr:hypothetical protein PCANC_22919 [Puccinia coronata f. sp. avenae]
MKATLLGAPQTNCRRAPQILHSTHLPLFTAVYSQKNQSKYFTLPPIDSTEPDENTETVTSISTRFNRLSNKKHDCLLYTDQLSALGQVSVTVLLDRTLILAQTYNANTTASILPPHDFPEGSEVNPTVWTTIQDNPHVEEPKKSKHRAKKNKKAFTPSVTAPTSQEAIGGASHKMDVDQHKRLSATPMPMTPQPTVRPVEALGAAANALPNLPPGIARQEESPAMTLTEACQELLIPNSSGTQSPGGNNPVPPIDSLKEQVQISLIMLNTHYDSYVGANNRRHLAIAEMHLQQCISAQETLRSRVGDAMTITLSQGYHSEATHASSVPHPPPNISQGSYPQVPMPNMPNHQVNTAPGPYNHALLFNQQSEAVPAPPFQGQTEYHLHRSQGRKPVRGGRTNYSSNENKPSLNRGLERMMATAKFLQRASAYMDRRGRSRSSQSNCRRK